MPTTRRSRRCICRASWPRPTAPSSTRAPAGSLSTSSRMMPRRYSWRGPNISGCVPHWCVPAALVDYLGDTVAVALSREPQPLVTRTQNSVAVVIGGVCSEFDVAPAIGNAVEPVWPWYHWYLNGPLPPVTTFRFAREPDVTLFV